ncbi:MAG: hypothetical protein AAB312_04870, partial [Pseudomonadota bacterium]
IHPLVKLGGIRRHNRQHRYQNSNQGIPRHVPILTLMPPSLWRLTKCRQRKPAAIPIMSIANASPKQPNE